MSNTDAILQLIDDWTAGFHTIESKYVQLARLDISEAFDKLQPSILIDKMRSYGLNENILDILDNFLKGRKQCVKVNAIYLTF